VPVLGIRCIGPSSGRMHRKADEAGIPGRMSTENAARRRLGGGDKWLIPGEGHLRQWRRLTSLVAGARERLEPSDVCRECPRRATGTQKLHPGKDLGSKDKEQGDSQQNSRGR